jgi:hypothetical protein
VIAFLLALALLRPAAGLTLIQSNGTVTLAWDATTDPVDGYQVHYGAASGTYTTTTDVGPVTQWTTPALTAGQTDFFMVTSYRTVVPGEGPLISGPSNEVSTTIGPAPPDPACLPPLGANAVSIFITKVEATTGAVGSRMRLNFQLGSPGSPVTRVQANLNGQPVGEPATGTAIGGLWFPTPLQAGTYALSLTAVNAAGCSTTATKDASSKLMSVTVK